jgi:hypothetical protein
MAAPGQPNQAPSVLAAQKKTFTITFGADRRLVRAVALPESGHCTNPGAMVEPSKDLCGL